ncbi:MAG: hypothetical protein PHP82_01615 [Candidatus ainarchaeum sp.]|nr:hypothetical protein [Candidatus ainarchaeum sp.]
MKKRFVIFTIIIIFLIFGCINIEVEKTYPNIIQNNINTTISELKESFNIDKNYNIEGYVVKIYSCPPCPEGASCKPCMQDNIIISEKNFLLENYALSSTEIILFVENPKQFELGKKYVFSIKITNHNSTNELINDIDLVGYNKIE